MHSVALNPDPETLRPDNPKAEEMTKSPGYFTLTLADVQTPSAQEPE